MEGRPKHFRITCSACRAFQQKDRDGLVPTIQPHDLVEMWHIFEEMWMVDLKGLQLVAMVLLQAPTEMV